MIPMLSFLAPSRLWLLLLIPALVALYLWLVQRKKSRNSQLGRTMFDLVIPRDRTWLRHVAVGLSILSLLTLTVAFAKPKDQVSVPRERATVVVTIDISLSMEAEDVEPAPSTAIGEGIYTSLAALAQVPPDPDNPRAVVPARIVLLSDGKTQVGRPSDEAAQAARAQNVPIYTIAYGTANGYIEIGGRREPVPVDREELERISR